MISQRLHALFAIPIALAVVVTIAAPASAALPAPRVLPSGTSLYALDCQGSPIQLLSVDTASANATKIGSGSNITNSSCAYQPAWDAKSNSAYYEESGTPNRLVKVNLVTGVSSAVGPLKYNLATPDINAIAIGATGNAYALANNNIYPLDLATGMLSTPVPTTLRQAWGFAYDSVTKSFYAINDSGVISTVDPLTGAVGTPSQAVLGTSTNNEYSLQIDSNGIFWIENDGPTGNEADLWTLDPAAVATSAQLVNPITLKGTKIYSEALLLAPTQVAPVITTTPALTAAVVGTTLTTPIVTTGTQLITFALTGKLPTGLVLDPATGIISGTPTAVGTFTFTITATNASGSSPVVFTQTITPVLPVVSG